VNISHPYHNTFVVQKDKIKKPTQNCIPEKTLFLGKKEPFLIHKSWETQSVNTRINAKWIHSDERKMTLGRICIFTKQWWCRYGKNQTRSLLLWIWELMTILFESYEPMSVWSQFCFKSEVPLLLYFLLPLPNAAVLFSQALLYYHL
jgi:hypothetical protein